MDILISFCNTSEFPGFPNLGILNVESSEYSILEIPEKIPQTGMVGMTYSSKYIFIGLHHITGGLDAFESPPALLVFDKATFQLLHAYECRFAKDIHSFLLQQDERKLFIVSTGTDDIIELELDEFNVVSEKVFMH